MVFRLLSHNPLLPLEETPSVFIILHQHVVFIEIVVIHIFHAEIAHLFVEGLYAIGGFGFAYNSMASV